MSRITPDEQRTIDHIQMLINRNDAEDAREILRGLIQAHPDHAHYWYLASQVALNKQQRVYFLEQANRIDPLLHPAANDLHRLQVKLPRNAAVPAQPTPVTHNTTLAAGASIFGAVSQVETAPLWRRITAYIIDSFYLVFILQSVSFVLALTAFRDMQTANPQWLSATFGASIAVYTWYQWWYLTQRNGQTLGKRLTGLQVIRVDGQRLTLSDVILRSLIGYTISSLALGIGFFWAGTNDEQRTWHDLLANTRVISVLETKEQTT